jgi:hypothetical protein
MHNAHRNIICIDDVQYVGYNLSETLNEHVVYHERTLVILWKVCSKMMLIIKGKIKYINIECIRVPCLTNTQIYAKSFLRWNENLKVDGVENIFPFIIV